MVHFDYATHKSVNGYFNSTDKSTTLGAPAADTVFQGSYGRSASTYYFPGGFTIHWGYRPSNSAGEFALTLPYESIYGVFASRLQTTTDQGAISLTGLRQDATTSLWYINIDASIGATGARDSFYYMVIGKCFQDKPDPSFLAGITHWDAAALASSTNYFETLHIANEDNTEEVKFNMNGSYVDGSFSSSTTLTRGGVVLPLDVGFQWGTAYSVAPNAVYATPFNADNNFIFTTRLTGSSTATTASAITGTPNKSGFAYDANLGDATKDGLIFFTIGNKTLT